MQDRTQRPTVQIHRRREKSIKPGY